MINWESKQLVDENADISIPKTQALCIKVK